MGRRSRGLRGRSQHRRSRPPPPFPRPVQGRATVASSQSSNRYEPHEPVLITEAEPSLADQHAARKRRYSITMAIRGTSLVIVTHAAPDAALRSTVDKISGLPVVREVVSVMRVEGEDL